MSVSLSSLLSCFGQRSTEARANSGGAGQFADVENTSSSSSRHFKQQTDSLQKIGERGGSALVSHQTDELLKACLSSAKISDYKGATRKPKALSVFDSSSDASSVNMSGFSSPSTTISGPLHQTPGVASEVAADRPPWAPSCLLNSATAIAENITTEQGSTDQTSLLQLLPSDVVGTLEDGNASSSNACSTHESSPYTRSFPCELANLTPGRDYRHAHSMASWPADGVAVAGSSLILRGEVRMRSKTMTGVDPAQQA